MSDELTIKKDDIVTLTQDNDGLTNLLKPLIEEIHLFDSFVAGTSFIDNSSLLDSLKIGDKLILVREDNKFDSNAIIIKTQDKQKIGYVPEKDNVIFARLMDAGKCLSAKIKQIEKKGSFTKISIGIYLVDF